MSTFSRKKKKKNIKKRRICVCRFGVFKAFHGTQRERKNMGKRWKNPMQNRLTSSTGMAMAFNATEKRWAEANKVGWRRWTTLKACATGQEYQCFGKCGSVRPYGCSLCLQIRIHNNKKTSIKIRDFLTIKLQSSPMSGVILFIKLPILEGSNNANI